MREYLIVIFAGMIGIFLYNFFASLLRSLGNSVVPLLFLAVSACLNIGLDLLFVAGLGRGVAGAAEATVISQYVSGIGIAVYTGVKFPHLFRREKGVRLRFARIREITSFSALTCLQQSIMNLGILAVQGLVNSFGTTIMAAFAAAVKIDAFAYLPVQDFGNAFSIFVAQNFGAGQEERIRKGIRGAVMASLSFGAAVSLAVFVFAEPLMTLFIDAGESGVIREGVRYLRIEGSFYFMIGGSVFAVRTLPGHRKAGNVRGADSDLAGNQGRPGLRALRSACRGGCGNLVGSTHWLAAGRLSGSRLLFFPDTPRKRAVRLHFTGEKRGNKKTVKKRKKCLTILTSLGIILPVSCEVHL